MGLPTERSTSRLLLFLGRNQYTSHNAEPFEKNTAISPTQAKLCTALCCVATDINDTDLDKDKETRRPPGSQCYLLLNNASSSHPTAHSEKPLNNFPALKPAFQRCLLCCDITLLKKRKRRKTEKKSKRSFFDLIWMCLQNLETFSRSAAHPRIRFDCSQLELTFPPLSALSRRPTAVGAIPAPRHPRQLPKTRSEPPHHLQLPKSVPALLAPIHTLSNG
jgi:hypothetical protein